MIERAIISGLIVTVFLILWFVSRQIQVRWASRVMAVIPSVSNQPSLLYFKSDNCAPCAAQEHYLRDLEESSGLRVRRVDVDYDPEAADKYGIFTVPTTLIVGQDGAVMYANYGVANLKKLTHQLERVQ